MISRIEKVPKISIGLPIYNGENFLRKSIDSVLQQTESNFELLISDNASTDGTQEICRYYQARDKRIKYFRHKTNIGAAPNFNYLVDWAEGTYFKWLAHDDMLDPNCLGLLAQQLDENANAVLATALVRVIDAEDQICDQYDGAGAHFNNESVVDRFHHTIAFHRQRCYEIFGLIRTSRLVETGRIRSYKNGDGVLLAELALEGTFVQVPKALMFLRRHDEQSQRYIRNPQTYSEWFDSSNRGRLVMPYWQMFREFDLLLRESDLSSGERRECRKYLRRQFVRSWRQLRGDLRQALMHSIGHVAFKLKQVFGQYSGTIDSRGT